MSFWAPEAPQAPDPMQTSAAQTSTNVGTALANTAAGNVNQVTPYGSLTYEQTGTYTYVDPYTGQSYDIPQTTATTTLSPESQAIYDTTMGTMGNMANLANSQSAYLGTTLATPMTTEGLPGWGTLPTAPTLSTAPTLGTVSGGPQLATSYGNDKATAKQTQDVEEALMARQQPGLDASQAALDASLANQGLALGSEAYAAGQMTQSQMENDAQMAAILAAGQEQSRIAQMDYQEAMFGNTAEQQMWNNQLTATGFNNNTAMTTVGFNNDVAQQGFGNNMSLFGAQNDLNQMAFQQEAALRNQGINEMNALMTGSQVTVPQFTMNQPAPIPTTDVSGNIYNSYAAEQAAYQTQMAQMNSLFGGFAGMGAAGITGYYS